MKDDEKKIYPNAQATIDDNKILSVFREGEVENIAQFQSEYYQYWEYIEE